MTYVVPENPSCVQINLRKNGLRAVNGYRLQHDLRKLLPGWPGFSRKVSVRSVGENTRHQVEDYIANQVSKERFLDLRYEGALRQFTVRCPEVDLSQPTASSHGCYWYNLHVVLVVAERGPIHDLPCLAKIRDGCFAIARKKGHRIAVLSVMPDHVHMAMRGAIEESPQEIALGFQNNLAYLLGQVRIWSPGFYVGTFSEYDMGAIRAGRSALAANLVHHRASSKGSAAEMGMRRPSRQSGSPSSKLEGVRSGDGRAPS